MLADASALKVLQTVKLHNTEPGSNKVYIVSLVDAGNETATVDTQWGPYPTPNRTGTKTPKPLPLAEAQAVFDALVKEQVVKKKYKVVEGGTKGPVLIPGDTKEDSGLRPQLLNIIEAATTELLMAAIERLQRDPAWIEEEKENGRRHMIDVEGGRARGINRKGEYVGIVGEVAAELIERLKTYGRTALDGEQVGPFYRVFDVLFWNGEDVRSLPYIKRLAIAETIVEGLAHVRFVEYATTTADKRRLLERLREENNLAHRLIHEGVCFKRADSPYQPGRPATGGAQLKWPFFAEADVIITAGRPGKRSVGMELRDGIKRVPVGNVSIPSSCAIPTAGVVAKIRYKCAFEGGSLFQPIWLNEIRTDKSPEECTLAQLWYAPPSVETDPDSDA